MVTMPVEPRAKNHSRLSSEMPRQAHASRWIHFGIESNALLMSQNGMNNGSSWFAASSNRLRTSKIAVWVPRWGGIGGVFATLAGHDLPSSQPRVF